MDKFYAIDSPDDVEPIDLPYSVSYSCLVYLGESRVALIGGINGTGSHKTMLIYDIISKTFSLGPQLNIGRSNHACYVHSQHPSTYLHDDIKGNTYIGNTILPRGRFVVHCCHFPKFLQ